MSSKRNKDSRAGKANSSVARDRPDRETLPVLDAAARDLANRVVEATIPMCVVRGRDLICELANVRFVEMVKGRQIVGKPLLEAVPELANQGYDKVTREVMRTGLAGVAEEVTLRFENSPARGIDESCWTFVHTPIRERSGAVTGLVIACNEVTDRVVARRHTETVADDLTSFFENSAMALHWIGPDGTIVRANQAELELLGYSGDEYIGRNIAEFHVDPHVIADMLRRLAAGQTIREYKARVRCKDGAIKHVLIDSNVQWGERGEFAHTRCFTRDVTDRVVSEQRLAAELAALTRIQRLSTRFVQPGDLSTLIDEILDVAIEITGADKGNVQLLHESSLKIVSHRGFDAPFLDFFGAVHSGQAACGTAMETNERVIVDDVAASPVFAGTAARDVLLAANVRAVQSTPLISRSGRMLGMFSTHYTTPRRPSEGILRLLDVLTRQAADLIERAQAEQALRESEARFRHMADHAPVIVWVTEADGASTFLSASWQDFTGQTAESALGFGWLDVVHPDDRARTRDAFVAAGAKKEGFELEYRLRRSDGEYRWAIVVVSPRFGGPGELLGYVGSVIDISERRDAEEARARLAAIVDSADDAIVSKTLQGVIQSWNRGAERMFGWTEAEAVGRHITLIIPEERHAEEDDILARIRRGEKVEHFETVRIAKDGRRLNISLTVSPIRDHAGVIIGASKIARDVSDRRRLEDERDRLLVESQASNRAKDHLLATVSHELRTPLNSILGYARMLENGSLDDEGQRHAIEVINRSATSQAQLIEDLLDLSRSATGRMQLTLEKCDLTAIVDGALDIVRPGADAKGVVLTSACAADVGPVLASPDRMRQVIWNLVSNAIKFTPRGGRVDVTLRRSHRYAEIVVADTGIGISVEMLPHVFELFRQEDNSTTRAHGGLGLGLALVKSLVELHGGYVTAESAGRDAGARFVVALPLATLRD